DQLITNQLLYRTKLRQPDKKRIIALPVPPELPPAAVNPYFPGAGLKTRPCTACAAARPRTTQFLPRPKHSGCPRDRASESTPDGRTVLEPDASIQLLPRPIR